MAFSVDEEDGEYIGGTVVRRFDAMLDIACVPFSFGEVQDLYLGTSAELAAAKPAWLLRHVPTLAGAAGGFAGGWFGIPTAGVYAAKGSGWLLDQFSKADDNVRAIARLVVDAAAIAVDATPDNLSIVDRIVDYLSGLQRKEQIQAVLHPSGGNAAEHEQQARILKAAITAVTAVRV
jgi:hypothetical protein